MVKGHLYAQTNRHLLAGTNAELSSVPDADHRCVGPRDPVLTGQPNPCPPIRPPGK